MMQKYRTNILLPSKCINCGVKIRLNLPLMIIYNIVFGTLLTASLLYLIISRNIYSLVAFVALDALSIFIKVMVIPFAKTGE